ncbi:APC family permease [Methanolobus profundi]|uniref:Amino acid/polyamine/organocation transporter, APC superfamily n=1 Tax=Methanolobus profundi TaxID=487685 RepID=A0A1I4UY96_9EURY|nr:amino acid permease [Methanolobus profundi]SFM93969.1 amino acid/polyamine/organocation transporter, APC superfamily [Methanolobus profundi]
MTKLERTITLKKGIALATSMLIGSGILALPGLAISIGNVHEVILAWLLITFITIPRIQISSRLGLRFPSTAGIATYVEEAVGTGGRYSVSYLVSGSYLFGLPAIAFIGSEYMQELFGLSEFGRMLCAIIIISLMFVSNLAGIRFITFLNYLSITVLFLLLGLIIAFNYDFVGSGLQIAGEALTKQAIINPSAIWNVTALLFWAFLGWENLSFSLGEIKEPERNVSRIYWLSFVLVAAIYMLIALITVGASATGISLNGAAGLSSLVLYIPNGKLLIGLIIIVLAANACSWNFTASRLIYASGNSGVFPAVFGKLSKKMVPLTSLIALYALSVSLITGCYLFKIPIESMMLLVNQNFIFLCGFVIIAYLKTEDGWQKWIFAVLSFLSLSFLASGFTWKVIYPVFLIGLGYFRFITKREHTMTSKTVDPQSGKNHVILEETMNHPVTSEK